MCLVHGSPEKKKRNYNFLKGALTRHTSFKEWSSSWKPDVRTMSSAQPNTTPHLFSVFEANISFHCSHPKLGTARVGRWLCSACSWKEKVILSIFTFSSPHPLPKEDLHLRRASNPPQVKKVVQVSRSLAIAIVVVVAVVFPCFLHWKSITRIVNGCLKKISHVVKYAV